MYGTAAALQRRQAPHYAPALIAFLLAAYLLDCLVCGPVVGGLAGNYLLPTLLWGLLALFVLSLPQARPAGRLRLRRLLCWLAVISVGVAALGMLLQGFMGGFGLSPYDRSLVGIIVNFLSLGAVIAATELVRSWLVNRFFRRRPVTGISVVAVCFTFLSFPVSKLAALEGAQAAVTFAGSDLFPTLSESFLATYLAFLGGPVPAIIYQGGLVACERLSPVLPAGNWAAQFLIGVAAPVVGLIMVRAIYLHEARVRNPGREEGLLGWLATGVAAVLLIWFCFGVFSVFPRVVVSGSMAPAIKMGDVAIVRETAPERVEVGDVILFVKGEAKVLHRVAAVKERGDGKVSFITKGDANERPDLEPVPEEHVLGEVVTVIPKAGWLTLALRGA